MLTLNYLLTGLVGILFLIIAVFPLRTEGKLTPLGSAVFIFIIVITIGVNGAQFFLDVEEEIKADQQNLTLMAEVSSLKENLRSARKDTQKMAIEVDALSDQNLQLIDQYLAISANNTDLLNSLSDMAETGTTLLEKTETLGAVINNVDSGLSEQSRRTSVLRDHMRRAEEYSAELERMKREKDRACFEASQRGLGQYHAACLTY